MLATARVKGATIVLDGFRVDVISSTGTPVKELKYPLYDIIEQ